MISRALATALISLGVLVCLTVTAAADDTADRQELLHAVQGDLPAPDFSLTDVDGNVHSLSAYRGKVLIINFWATWCPPCREEMPAMQRAFEKIRDDGNILMLAIDVGEDEDTVFEFTADYPVEFPLLLDTDSRVVRDWPVRGLPTTFIVDKHGRLAYHAIGSRAWDSPVILEMLRELAAK